MTKQLRAVKILSTLIGVGLKGANLLLVLVHEAVKHSHSSCDEASKAKEGHGFHVA